MANHTAFHWHQDPICPCLHTVTHQAHIPHSPVSPLCPVYHKHIHKIHNNSIPLSPIALLLQTVRLMSNFANIKTRPLNLGMGLFTTSPSKGSLLMILPINLIIKNLTSMNIATISVAMSMTIPVWVTEQWRASLWLYSIRLMYIYISNWLLDESFVRIQRMYMLTFYKEKNYEGEGVISLCAHSESVFSRPSLRMLFFFGFRYGLTGFHWLPSIYIYIL